MEQAFELVRRLCRALGRRLHGQAQPRAGQGVPEPNIVLMKNMIADGYQTPSTIWRAASRRSKPGWPTRPAEADKDAEYAAVIEIDLADIKEPIVCCPNDPDDAKFLSEVAGTKIDEAFIGSCMTNIGHFRAAATLLRRRDIPVKLGGPAHQDGRLS